MDALQRLRFIQGEEALALENNLEDELRRLQRASLREMGTFAINTEVPGERDRIIATFSEMDLPTALKSFALLDNSPRMEDLKAQALKQGQSSPLSAMMGIKHIDDEGKTIVNTAGAGLAQARITASIAALKRVLSKPPPPPAPSGAPHIKSMFLKQAQPRRKLRKEFNPF